MTYLSPQAQEIARLKAETQKLRKKRYHGMIGLLLGAAGLAAMLAGLPDIISYALWGMGFLVWAVLKRV